MMFPQPTLLIMMKVDEEVGTCTVRGGNPRAILLFTLKITIGFVYSI
jgi:hypothetical protein